MKNNIVQLLILGGGPAGCAAAISAINEGATDVVIVEKEPYDRHRIGEILLTQTVLEFKSLGIEQEISAYAEKYQWGRKYAAAYIHGQDRTPWKVQNNYPLASSEDQPHIPRCFVNPDTQLWYTLMVRRHEFDESLRAIAAKKGVRFIEGTAHNIKIISEDILEDSTISSVEIQTPNDNYRINAQFVIDATGQHALIPRTLKKRTVIDDWGLQAKYSYFEGIDFENAKNHGLFDNGANILSYEDGWVWIANLGRGLTSIGIVSKTWDKDNNSFWNKLKNLPEYKVFGIDKAIVKDFKGNPTNQDNFYSHPNYRFKSEVMRGKNWACCGDSAMFLDPLLSQGVTLAITFGRQLGKIAYLITNEDVESKDVLQQYEQFYINEMEVLNKVVSLWYQKDFSFNKDWSVTAQKISHIFGREIGDDVESFRWISNLENIHNLINNKNDKVFLEELNEVNNIKLIHDFEKVGILKI
jgi:flavin-dependent dehydrogenase